MSDNVLHCDGRDAERCDCCPANDPSQPDVCWLKAPLSAMTAAELVERLAGFQNLSIRQAPTILPYEITGGAYGGRLDPYSTTFRVVGMHAHNGICIGQATTLSAALEKALRKAASDG